MRIFLPFLQRLLEMIKMLERNSLAVALLAAAFVFGHSTSAWSAEPRVEVPTVAAPNDEDSGFAFPKIPLSLSIFANGGYDNNFRTSQSAQGSWFTTEGVSLSYDSPGTATQLKLHSGADLTYYPDQSGGRTDNINAYADASLKHNVSTRLTLDAIVYATYRTEPDFRSNVGADSRQGNFFNTRDSLSVHYNWSERFSTQTNDNFQLVRYESGSSLGASLDRLENTIGQELRYDLLHKGNTLVAEYRFEIIDYDTSPRDSLTHFALLGLNQDFTSYLKLIVRGGATFRSYTEGGQDQINPSFEGSITYSGAHNSSLAWNTSFGVEEPTTAVTLSRTTFRTGLGFRYGFTARILGTVNAYYHHDDNQGTVPASGLGMPVSGFSEDSFDVSADLRYVMNRRFSFDLGFQHSEISSAESSRDYSRYRYSAGITFTY